MIDTLHHLRNAGVRLGIVTNGAAVVQQAKIEQLGLSALVDAVLISEREGVRKPNPEIFYRAVARLGVEVSQTCVAQTEAAPSRSDQLAHACADLLNATLTCQANHYRNPCNSVVILPPIWRRFSTRMGHPINPFTNPARNAVE